MTDAKTASELERALFVDALVHDLRGPLSVAQAAMQLVWRRTGDPDTRHLAVRALDSVRRAESMLRDILDVSRVRAGEPLPIDPAPCDLSSLVRDVVDELALCHGPRFRAELDEGVRGVWCGRELRRALWNLGHNAVQHGAGNGEIVIELRRTEAGARVAVHNHGEPIPEVALPHLFEPFFRVGEGPGWGLGLALVRACAEAHGGRVEVCSDAADTCFAVELPWEAPSAVEKSGKFRLSSATH